MFIFLISCTFRTMIGATTHSIPTDVSNVSADQIQLSTQHYMIIPAGPSFKGQWSENEKQISAGLGIGLISFLPQRSKWFMNPPTIGVQLLEWHEIDQESYLGTLSPFVQLTAPPICLGIRTCLHSISPFIEYEYSNIIGHENEHSWTLGLYWSPSN